MPAPAVQNLANGTEFVRKDQTLDSNNISHGSGFTAVNGRASRSPTNGAVEQTHPVRPPTHDVDHKASIERQPENWSHPNGPYRQERQSANGSISRKEFTSSHKRKRSGSNEAEESRSGVIPVNGERQRTAGLMSPETDQLSDRSSSDSPEQPLIAPRRWPSPTRAQRPSSVDGYETSLWQHRAEGPAPRAATAQPREYHMDPEAQQSPNYQSGDPSTSSLPPDSGGSVHETTRAGVQVDPKKRKRQFANRTKTGCQTCRRRKKKCDENKPECFNCVRGGFVCEGYTIKQPWTKPDTSRGPVQIVSKEEGGPANMYHRFPSHPPREFETQAQQQDGGRARPIVVDDAERRNSRGPWPPNWPNSGNEQPPPPPPPQTRPYPPPAPQEYGQPPAQGPPKAYHEHAPPPPQHHPSTSNYPPPAGITANPPIPAALPLQHPPQHPPHNGRHGTLPPPPLSAKFPPQQQAPPPPPSEKDKMLRGDDYLIMDSQLVRERDACKEVLWRYNNAISPVTKATREQRDAMFREIISAAWVPRGPGYPAVPVGTAGRNVTVEAPFTCDYGYNINIGDNVLIGQNCTISDSVKVSIGANTIIGPNVSIFAGTASTDPKRRVTGKGICGFGREIKIEEDCFIGGNVILMPGVTVARGSTVGAGSVIREHVPPRTVTSQGERQRVLRGIWGE